MTSLTSRPAIYQHPQWRRRKFKFLSIWQGVSLTAILALLCLLSFPPPRPLMYLPPLPTLLPYSCHIKLPAILGKSPWPSVTSWLCIVPSAWHSLLFFKQWIPLIFHEPDLCLLFKCSLCTSGQMIPSSSVPTVSCTPFYSRISCTLLKFFLFIFHHWTRSCKRQDFCLIFNILFFKFIEFWVFLEIKKFKFYHFLSPYVIK